MHPSTHIVVLDGTEADAANALAERWGVTPEDAVAQAVQRLALLVPILDGGGRLFAQDGDGDYMTVEL